jgi:carboxyl-terminal processing protease
MTRNRTLYLFILIAAYLLAGHPLATRSHGQNTPGSTGSVHSVGVSPARNGGDIPGADDYAKTLQDVWSEVKRHFYDPRLHGVDWDHVRDQYLAQVNNVRSKSDFKELVNRMLRELHASHTDFVTTDDVEYYMMWAVRTQQTEGNEVAQIGVMGQPEADGYHVSAVLNGEAAIKAGIEPGDVLLTADGEPYLSAASLRNKAGREVRVGVRGVDGKSRFVEVVPTSKNILKSFLDATRTSAQILNVNGKRIGYVHLWTMATDVFRRTLEGLVLGRLHDTDGLILDLRDGYGGTPFGFSDVFLRPDLSWEMQAHDGATRLSYTGYGKPMVVLINSGTRSAKEFLTYQLKSAHRATIIGLRTAGAFLGASFIPIGKDNLLELAVEGLRVNGAPLENRGVDPDVVVAAAGTYTDRDAQLLYAENLLGHTPTPPNRDSGAPGIIHVH